MANVQKKTLQATDKVDELENDKSDRPPNPDPSKTGTPTPEAKQKCSRLLRVGRKHKNAGSGETAAGPSHKRVKSVTVTTETPVLTGLKLRIPAHKPPPRQNSEPPPEHPTPRASPPLSSDMPPPPVPQPPLFLPSATPAPRPRPELTPPPMDNPGDLGNGGLFGRPTGLLDDPPALIVSAQDESEGPPVANSSESTTCEALAECIRLLEGRVDDEEFELTQIHQMRVEQQTGAVQGQRKELKRLKDQLKDM
ncbi:hypothetical protein M404DRAFT_31168 [Pisolithus tinctorius Marx 270]|uniref:Uncharacterized protein n=1 Tax=Pisolithus tinctorius Marx 270 TaxID=870435 RepID=A0A0C3INY3_PISTI|nr:hypothetical protein M404DRAFT_31168 [Pisolithus tinctorius Marx 270]